MSGKKKTALVVEGGGMRGIFTAGILDCFLENDFDPFDIYIGVSAGACNLASHLSRQHLRNYHCYTDYMLRPEFFSLKKFIFGGHFMDLDWMWDCLAVEEPLFADKAAEKNLYSVVTDVKSGEAAYIKADKDSLADYLKASSSLPLLYRGFVNIEGFKYADGGIADPIPVQAAVRMGAKRIMLLRTRPADYVKKSFIESSIIPRFFGRYPELKKTMMSRDRIYNESLKFIDSPPAGIEIINICPNNMKTGRTTSDLSLIEKDYMEGKKTGLAAAEMWMKKQTV